MGFSFDDTRPSHAFCIYVARDRGIEMPVVLVAEDDAAIRKLICAVVRKQGVDVVSASDGAETLARAQEGSYDALLLDLMMPNQSGWAVVEQLSVWKSPLLARTVGITAASD